ncbi:hypothetical protein ADICEAN_03760 [Cesiribacter andamanensis AMV16]|uniref:Uncharacterized protein n=1 Tax=Cesiribacter andamanensis AMV16 TaxID=1279009 RepID=M7N1M1_9BACT|nr:hypothetical protein ADICEAN_03760 [Cesiribacter andamanensis AMV16]
MCLEHGRENDAVKHNIVLANKVQQAGIGALPVGLPIAPFPLGPLLGSGDVANGSIKPHIEHLAAGFGQGYGHTPVQVPGYGAGLQALLNPAFALSVDVGLPLFMLFKDPLPQPGLILLQGQVPVGSGAQYGLGTAEHGAGVDEVGGAQAGAAALALIAIGFGVAAIGAGTLDVAIGQKLGRLLIIILLTFLNFKSPLLLQGGEKVGCGLVMYGRRGAGVHIKGYPKLLKGIADHAVVLVYHLLGAHPFFLSADGNGHPMFIGTTDKQHILSPAAQVAYVNIGRHIYACQVTNVHGAIGIG